MKLSNLVQTGEACPSQWEATNEAGEAVYIRYRFDRLTVNCPADMREMPGDIGPLIFVMDDVYGDEWRGVMSTEEMLRTTGYELAGEDA